MLARCRRRESRWHGEQNPLVPQQDSELKQDQHFSEVQFLEIPSSHNDRSDSGLLCVSHHFGKKSLSGAVASGGPFPSNDGLDSEGE